jgi:hypothetical protein
MTMMKNTTKIILENTYNKELYLPSSNPESKTIDGVEYIKVTRISNQKDVMVRKDSLKEIKRKTKLK